MPNHITTQIEISGSKQKIDKLIQKTKIVEDTEFDENQFDFNGIVKMPEELKKTVSPTSLALTEEDAAIENKIYKKRGLISQEQDIKFISVQEKARRLKEYGATNWYDWANKNWGTKWNAYEVKFIAHKDNKLVIQISTAWDTPQEIWKALEEQGYTVKGIMYGEMEGYEFIGQGNTVFDAYQTVEVEYIG